MIRLNLKKFIRIGTIEGLEVQKQKGYKQIGT